MSQEVAITAIIQPAPGKLERIKEALVEAMKWMEANEPETLEFSIYEEDGKDGEKKLAMFERYASQAALEKHQSSDNYKAFFKQATEDQLFVGMPTIVEGKHFHSFRR